MITHEKLEKKLIGLSNGNLEQQELAGLIRAAIRSFQAQLRDMTQDRDAWKHETETFSHAWQRELENKLIPKTHLIDALVLTTRSLVKSERSLRVELAEKERERPICRVAECKEHAFETSHFCSRHRVEVGPPTA